MVINSLSYKLAEFRQNYYGTIGLRGIPQGRVRVRGRERYIKMALHRLLPSIQQKGAIMRHPIP